MDSLCGGQGSHRHRRPQGTEAITEGRFCSPPSFSRMNRLQVLSLCVTWEVVKRANSGVHSDLLNLKVLEVGPILLDFLFNGGLIFIFYFFKTRSLRRPGWP